MTSTQETDARGRGTPGITTLTVDQAGAAIAMLVNDGHLQVVPGTEDTIFDLPVDVRDAYRRAMELMA